MPLTRSIIESTVVITGASSGVGAATSLTLACRGAQLVLAARSPRGLAQIGEQCRQLGADVLEVPTDTSDPDAVERLAEAAQERFGHIDAWINNAGVALYGRLLDLPLDQVRRTIDVDVFGYLHGARAAVPRLRAAGEGCWSSSARCCPRCRCLTWGRTSWPSTRCRAWPTACGRSCGPTAWTRCPCARCCRARWTRPVRVGREPDGPPGPAAAAAEPAAGGGRPDRAAAGAPRRQSFVGRAASTVMWQWRLAPALAERLLSLYGQLAQFGRPEPPSDGNLFEPVEVPREVEGGWRLTPATLATLPSAALAKVRHHLNGAGTHS
ncbi:SDR family NAD(P)-dependent oxidoreductase [Catellatospora bangladeshensis]|uniref:SDR family NAD(P)-dependent oxidoreductase n=1 Tax=Catellatospora bangladeshensis TaxID=310355 RepID=UPI003615D70D